MNWNYPIEIGFGAVNWLMAWWHSRLIKAGRPIAHWAWTLLYGALIVIAFWFTRQPILAVAAVFMREIVFSPVLNRYRDLDFWYMNPAGPSSSLVDRIVQKTQKPVYWASVAALLTLQYFLCNR